MKSSKLLIIQTAFIGDVILATALVEKLRTSLPNIDIDFLVRQGNESLLVGHPHIRKLHVWNKSKKKWSSWLELLFKVRAEHYTYVITLQRFATMGLFTVLSGAEKTIGFDKNPFSSLFSLKVKHEIRSGIHELDRNQALIAAITDTSASQPRLYPSEADFEIIKTVHPEVHKPYICVAPSSVWFSKTLPEETWIEFLKQVQNQVFVYLLGSRDDAELCQRLEQHVSGQVVSLAGKLSLSASAAMISKSAALFANDSAPLHIASAMNVPTCAVFCSTHTDFGFGPTATRSIVVHTLENLPCRPCGLAGKPVCPEGHFKCGRTITATQLMQAYNFLTQSSIS